MAAVAAFALAGTSFGQTLSMMPVGEKVMTDGTRAYVVPQTTLAVDLQVRRETVVTGPYARFAQKYFGVIAPLADKDIYTIESATVSCYDTSNAPDTAPGRLPEATVELCPVDGGDMEFPRVLPDRLSSWVRDAESSADAAAKEIFLLRNRRADLVKGDYTEMAYGAGLHDALEYMEHMEDEYLELFFGKRSITTYTVRYTVVPSEGSNTYVVCRFREDGGLLPADDLSGEPVVIECRPQGVAVSVYPPSKRGGSKSDTEYAVADMVDCRVMLDRHELGRGTVPVYQYGVRCFVPAM